MRISKKAVAPLLIWIGLILAGAIIVHNSNLKDTGDESNIELFSSLGQQAKCDIFPCKTGVFNDNKFISCCDSNSKYPGSGNCLINVFHENYAGTKPASECGSNEEVNGCVEYINSNYVSNLGVNSIYEVYNCPDGSLTSSINPGTCDCDYASTNKNCKISCNVENPICLGTCVSTGKFFKQCPNGLDGSSASCECDFSYFEDSTHQRCPSSKPYCVDNGELDYCASDVKCSKLDAVSCMANSNCIVGWYGCIDLASAKCSDIQPDKFGKYTPSSICAKKGCTLSGTQCISKKNSSVKITSITPRTESSKLIINVKWSGGVGPYIVEIEELDVYEKVNSFEYTSIVNYNGINKLNVCVYDSDYKTLNECKKLDINCIDSDLGNDIFNKGTVYYNKKSYLDECKVNSNFLEQGDQITEYSCVDGKLQKQTNYCGAALTCSNGACVSIPKNCGDEICKPSQGENKRTCPLDCGGVPPGVQKKVCLPTFSVLSSNQCFDNEKIIKQLNEKQRPLTAGLEIVLEGKEKGDYFACTIGIPLVKDKTINFGIIKVKISKNYFVTAAHCIERGTGQIVYQGGEAIGKVVLLDTLNDIALVEVNTGVSLSQETFIGDKITGISPGTLNQEVFKIGRSTGVTFGIIKDESYTFSDGATNTLIRASDKYFTQPGDSGAGVFLVNGPTNSIGILGGFISDDPGLCSDMKSPLDQCSYVSLSKPIKDLL